MDTQTLADGIRAMWDAVYEMAEMLTQTFREALAFLKKLEKPSQIRRRLWRRPKNQHPRALFLDRRRKTYHCRDACATDYW